MKRRGRVLEGNDCKGQIRRRTTPRQKQSQERKARAGKVDKRKRVKRKAQTTKTRKRTDQGEKKKDLQGQKLALQADARSPEMPPLVQ